MIIGLRVKSIGRFVIYYAQLLIDGVVGIFGFAILPSL